jgi:inorganic triphosphatase YgiF
MTHRGNDHGEVELKFELDRRAAKKVRRHPLLDDADHQRQSQSSVYFDTNKGEVHKAGYSLRVRQAEDCHTQTVKTKGAGAGLFHRGEWEAPVDHFAPERKALKQTPLGKLKKLDRKLGPTVCSDVERTTWLVDRDGSVIEVALDSGTVSAGDHDASFHELELELRDGSPTAMFDVAQELAHAVPLEIGVLSKERRGLMLAEGAFDHEQKASTPAIHEDQIVAEAFAAIVHECVRHFRLNQALIIAERDPDALHQARVAMRRLRTGFSLFRPAVRQGSVEPLRRELRDFIKPFGEARNLDVFLDTYGDELGWRDRRKLKSARTDAYDQVIDALTGQRCRWMFLDLVEWTASQDWRKNMSSEPIGAFSARQLDAAWKKVRRRASKVGDLKEQQLHRLRIDIKKLRYTVEFLAPLYRKKHVRKFSSSLEAMQDCLGLIHDDMVSRQIVADFGLAGMDRTDVTARSRQLKKLDVRFKRLKRTGRFWSY